MTAFRPIFQTTLPSSWSGVKCLASWRFSVNITICIAISVQELQYFWLIAMLTILWLFNSVESLSLATHSLASPSLHSSILRIDLRKFVIYYLCVLTFIIVYLNFFSSFFNRSKFSPSISKILFCELAINQMTFNNCLLQWASLKKLWHFLHHRPEEGTICAFYTHF